MIIFLLCCFLTGAMSSVLPTQPAYQLPATAQPVVQFFTQLELQLDSLPNPLELSDAERIRHVQHMAASAQRLSSLAAYHPNQMAQQYLTCFFKMYGILAGKQVDLNLHNSSSTHIIWRHELEYLRACIHSFSTALEKGLMLVRRNDNLTLQMAYDMTIINSFFRKIFIPAAFPKESWWRVFRFNLAHHPKTQKMVLLSGALILLAGGTLGCAYTLYTEHKKRTAAESKLMTMQETAHDPLEAQLAQTVTKLLGTTLPPQTDLIKFLAAEYHSIGNQLGIERDWQPTTLSSLISHLRMLYWLAEREHIERSIEIKAMLDTVTRQRKTANPRYPQSRNCVTPSHLSQPKPKLSTRHTFAHEYNKGAFELLAQAIGVKTYKDIARIIKAALKKGSGTPQEPRDTTDEALFHSIIVNAQTLVQTAPSLQSPPADQKLQRALQAFLDSVNHGAEFQNPDTETPIRKKHSPQRSASFTH